VLPALVVDGERAVWAEEAAELDRIFEQLLEGADLGLAP
jgi:hypothetical protein